jgi:hypothetical protein
MLIGQTCTVEQIGAMGPAQGPVDKSNKFNVDMEYNAGMNIGVTCVIQAGGSSGNSQACFVTRERLPQGGSVTLTAIDKVTVWFQVNASTGTMIAGPLAGGIEVDFSNDKTQTISFDGTWKNGALSA